MRRTVGVSWTIVALTLASLARADEPAPTTVDLSNGGLVITSGENRLTVGVFFQTRAVFENREAADADTAGIGVGEADGTTGGFQISRARLVLGGTVYREWLTWALNVGAGETSSDGVGRLKDAWLQIGRPDRSLRTGQFKVPFSFQELLPDFYQGFVERSLATQAFSPGRDVGMSGQARFARRRLLLQSGVFNGSGEGRAHPTKGMLYAVRAALEPLGEVTMVESSFDPIEPTRLHFGIGYHRGVPSKGRTPPGEFQETSSQEGLGLEAMVRRHRALLYAELFLERNETATGDLRRGRGFYVQGGWLILARRLEAGLRYSFVDANTAVSDDLSREARIAVQYAFAGHRLKVHADAGVVRHQPQAAARGHRLAEAEHESVDDRMARLQLQLLF